MDARRYLELFLAESRDHLEQACELHEELREAEVDGTTWRELLRHAHSLKGMAATMGLEPVVRLAHAVEDLLEAGEPCGQRIDDPSHALLGESLDCLARLIDRFEAGEDGGAKRAMELTRALRQLTGQATDAAVDATSLTPDDPLTDQRETLRVWRIEATLAPEATASAEATVRFLSRLASLGRVVEAGPPMLAAATGRFEGRINLTLETSLPRAAIEAELEQSTVLAAASVEPRTPTADDRASAPAARTRWIRVRTEQLDSLAEGLLDLRFAQGSLCAELRASGTEARQRVDRFELRLRQLYTTVSEMRLVPFRSLGHRLRRTVRDLEHELGKSCRLEIVGDHVRIDRLVLESLHEPLMHLVRNAMDHGIESPDERIAAAKPPRGRLRLVLERQRDRVHLILEDDGRGMDLERIRQRAVELGLLEASRAGRLSDAELAWLTTSPGFSTAERVSHVSGRGIGMDLVRDRLESLGGLVEIDSAAGRGTRVRLCVPPSIALVKTLLVLAGGERFAVPLEAVERTLEHGHAGRSVSLAACLGLDDRAQLDDTSPTLLVRDSADGFGLTVDEVLGRRDLVVSPLHAPLSGLTRYCGAAVVDDGSIVLVLDPVALARRRASG